MSNGLITQALHCFEQGAYAQAVPLLERACHDDPKQAQAWFLLGACRHALGSLDDALTAFERACELAPENDQAQQAAATVLLQQHKPQLALKRLTRLLHSRPQDPQLHFNIAVVCDSLHDSTVALRHYDHALQLEPDYRNALRNRGVTLISLHRLDDALANNIRYVALHPDDAHAYFNLGRTYLALDRYDEALDASSRAIQLDPQHGKAELDRGLALAALGRVAESWQAMARARERDPKGVIEQTELWSAHQGLPVDLEPREVYIVKTAERIDACDWTDLADFRAKFAEFSQQDEPYPLASRPVAFRALNFGLTQPLHLKLMRQIAAAIERKAGTKPIRSQPAVSGVSRIGYLSPDFKDHAVGGLVHEMLRLHDRKRFRVFSYALTPEEPGTTRSKIRSGSDVFRDLSQHGDLGAAEQIAADKIDLLIDLSGYTTYSRSEILALRPAPVTASYLGFLGSTGAKFIDYLITDRIAVPPDEEVYYDERLALLPSTFWVYNHTQAVPLTNFSRETMGLPKQEFVFCAFHNGYKIGPEIFDVWIRILQRTPGSVLWLIERDPRQKTNLHREAAARGIDPARLIFAPMLPNAFNLSRLQLADLFLDTPQYNAGATGLDALWAGLPMLTCPTRGIVGRMAASALLALDCPELIAGSFKEYEDKAVAYASQPDTLAAIRTELAKARTGAELFDTRTRVRELEAAYAIMIERYRTGLPPASFKVPT